MNSRILYSENSSMKIVAALLIVVILFGIYRYYSESVISHPYAGTYDGFYPVALFGSTSVIPPANY